LTAPYVNFAQKAAINFYALSVHFNTLAKQGYSMLK